MNIIGFQCMLWERLNLILHRQSIIMLKALPVILSRIFFNVIYSHIIEKGFLTIKKKKKISQFCDNLAILHCAKFPLIPFILFVHDEFITFFSLFAQM